MDSLPVLHQTIPNVGVIGSGSRRSPIESQQKLACMNGNCNNSSRSSTSGEEGFISGSSSAEEISYIDNLTTQFDSLGIGKPNSGSLYGTNEGASLMGSSALKLFSTLNNGAVFENSNLFTNRMKEDPASLIYQNQLTYSNQSNNLSPQQNANYLAFNQTRQLSQPGAWFFENTLDEPDSGSASTGFPGECSPVAELNDDYQYAAFRASLNNPYTVDEHVEVPSSEHVAEIVGRQGCKIKALRAKTNTYIKTPSRNESPIFKITGRPEDVLEAKHEIECAAEHFTQIRASRRHSQGGNPIPGHVTAYVRVPLRVVGLVVGPKGATIKRIQQDTHTYIITPSREREPIFEVTGLPENVASARREIEQHIYQRTGNMPITDPNATINDYDLIAAAQAAANNKYAQAQNNSNRPNYGALATGTHIRRASAALEAALGLQRNSANDPLNDLVRSISNPYSNSVSPSMSSGNNIYGSNSFYNSNEISSMNSVVAAALLRSASGEYHTTGNYQTWTSSGNTIQNGSSAFDLFSSVNSNAKLNALGNGFDSLVGNNLCNLNLSKSVSRDEGLGDSPTISMGKLNTDSYQFHAISSIWADLEANNGCDKSLDSLAFQLARA